MRSATHLSCPCLAVCFAAIVLAPVEAAHAACAEANPFQSVGEGVNLIHLDDDEVNDPVVGDAIEMWKKCSGYGSGFPKLSVSSGEVPVRIFYEEGACPTSGCACGERKNAVEGINGGIASADIHLYEETNSGESCAGHEKETLAHEIGHIYGLKDSGCPNSNPSCSYVWSRDSSNPPVLEVSYEP